MSRRAVGWVVGGLVALLAGCATRELVLEAAEAPWAAQGIASVDVPTFQAPPTAWAVADQARGRIRDALDRGTVRVTAVKPAAVLRGAVPSFKEASTPGAPRRILRSTGSTNTTIPLGTAVDTYAWEMDVTHAVALSVVVRLERDGDVLWTKEGFGTANETQAVTLNWPGSDPVPPPGLLAAPPDPQLFQRLRERALSQALEPLLSALTVRYEYRDVP